MSIPTFCSVNQLYDSEQKSWLLGAESFGSLAATETTEKKARETIGKVWKKLCYSEQNLLLQGLAVILNGKRLLLTGQLKTLSPLLLLDNLFLFLPNNARNKISLAVGGSVDPEYCNWAQIIVKPDGSSIHSLPENMVWLDFNKCEFDKEEYLDHEYVEDFIAPIQDKYENLITICEYLDNTTKGDSHDLGWEFEEVDGWLKLKNPSIDFIFNYPAEERDKIEILRKYIPRKCSTKNYPELEKRIISCEKIFRSDKEKFQLWDLVLAGGITMGDLSDLILAGGITMGDFSGLILSDLILAGKITMGNFKRLFTERLFPTFPFLDGETFEQSNLKQCWQKNFPDTLSSLNLYLSEKGRGIFHIPEIANDLKLSNYEPSKLYMTCLKSHLLTYQQSLPLLESAIEKSVSFIEERVKFRVDDFMAVYQWFNAQYFQDKSPDKFTDKSPEKISDKSLDPLELFLTSSEVSDISLQDSPDKSPEKLDKSSDTIELLSILSKLVIDSNSNHCINWQ